MKKMVLLGVPVVALLAVGVVALDPTRVLLGYLKGDHFFQGRPTTYWRRAVVDQNPAAQEGALKALKEGGPAAVPVLTDLLQTGGKSEWAGAEPRWRAAELLGQVGADAAPAVPALAAALHDGDPHVRKVAADALGQIGENPAVAVPALAEFLKTDGSLNAVKALAKFGADAKPAVPGLVELLNDKDATVRWRAAWALGQIGPDAVAATPALVETLKKDEDGEAREHAAESLGQIGPDAKAAVPDLIGALKDPDQRVRRDAARSLGQMGSVATSAIPALTELLKGEKVPRVQDAARKALQSLKAEAEKGH